MVLITCGLWLLVIPFYPAHCINCGSTRGEAIFTSMPKWAQAMDVVVFLAIVCAIVLDRQPAQPVPIMKGPKYNELSSRQTEPSAQAVAVESKPAPDIPVSEPAAPEVAPTTSNDPDSHKVREDGRVYSVALIDAMDMSVGTEVLAQGRVASFGYEAMRSRPFAVIKDEQQPDKTLLCAMMEDEGVEVVSLYHVGEVVRVSGEYMGTLGLAGNPSMPILSNCQVAGPQHNVVRPADAANPAHDGHLAVAEEPSNLDRDDTIYNPGGEVSPPKALFAPDPGYTAEARRAKLQGTCTLELVVGPDGHPRNIRVTHPLGGGLDEKAIENIQQWRFEPAMKDGKPIAAQISVAVTFHLWTELHSTIGDLGVQSGLIANTRSDLEILKHKGDRNYYEFTKPM
jgi:TonB family protein